jgi:hypothetical protein
MWTQIYIIKHLNEVEQVVGFQVSLLSSDFLTKILYAFLISPVFGTSQPNIIWGKGTTVTYLQNGQYLLIFDLD